MMMKSDSCISLLQTLKVPTYVDSANLSRYEVPAPCIRCPTRKQMHLKLVSTPYTSSAHKMDRVQGAESTALLWSPCTVCSEWDLQKVPRLSSYLLQKQTNMTQAPEPNCTTAVPYKLITIAIIVCNVLDYVCFTEVIPCLIYIALFCLSGLV